MHLLEPLRGQGLHRLDRVDPLRYGIRWETAGKGSVRQNLGGSVFGETSHAESVARALDTGMVGINKGCGGADGAPWVGAKESGFGFHSGKAGHRQFAQTRVISRAK